MKLWPTVWLIVVYFVFLTDGASRRRTANEHKKIIPPNTTRKKVLGLSDEVTKSTIKTWVRFSVEKEAPIILLNSIVSTGLAKEKKLIKVMKNYVEIKKNTDSRRALGSLFMDMVESFIVKLRDYNGMTNYIGLMREMHSHKIRNKTKMKNWVNVFVTNMKTQLGINMRQFDEYAFKQSANAIIEAVFKGKRIKARSQRCMLLFKWQFSKFIARLKERLEKMY